jgi:hypothetical protein
MFTFLNRVLFTENLSVFKQVPSENPADCEVQIIKIVHSLLGTSFTKVHKDIVVDFLFRKMGEKGPADLCLDLIKNKYDCERFIQAVAHIQEVQRIQNAAEKLNEANLLREQAILAKKAFDDAKAHFLEAENIYHQAAAKADEATALVIQSPLENTLHLPMPFFFSISLVLFLLVGVFILKWNR